MFAFSNSAGMSFYPAALLSFISPMTFSITTTLISSTLMLSFLTFLLSISIAGGTMSLY